MIEVLTRVSGMLLMRGEVVLHTTTMNQAGSEEMMTRVALGKKKWNSLPNFQWEVRVLALLLHPLFTILDRKSLRLGTAILTLRLMLC